MVFFIRVLIETESKILRPKIKQAQCYSVQNQIYKAPNLQCSTYRLGFLVIPVAPHPSIASEFNTEDRSHGVTKLNLA